MCMRNHRIIIRKKKKSDGKEAVWGVGIRNSASVWCRKAGRHEGSVVLTNARRPGCWWRGRHRWPRVHWGGKSGGYLSSRYMLPSLFFHVAVEPVESLDVHAKVASRCFTVRWFGSPPSKLLLTEN